MKSERLYNKRFLALLSIEVIFALTYLIVKILSGQPPESYVSALLSWEWPLLLSIGVVIVCLMQFMIQVSVSKRYEDDDAMLKIMYDTTLGMWSPK